MKQIQLNETMIQEYKRYLYEEERSTATIEKYMRDINQFYKYLPNDKSITKEILLNYKQYLFDKQYKITSMNSMIVAINSLLVFLCIPNYRLRLYKIQRNSFYKEDKELTKEEYKRLLSAAREGNNERLYILLQTICGTGIRVSEHQYLTVEAIRDGRAIVYNKGKVRTIFIPKELKKMLRGYCAKNKIIKGSVFVTKTGKPLDRSNIWQEMKKLCEMAKVEKTKVFPHNLRHLFALTYYRLKKDIVRLADLLGHASVDTTRIYTMTDGRECQRVLSKLELVSLRF